MNEIPLDKDEDELNFSTSNPLISSTDEVENLATDLADSYSSYLNVDVNAEAQRLEALIEECLARLVEATTDWENYKVKPFDKGKFINKVNDQSGSMDKLCEQIDSLEQYISMTNQTLDRLETTMKEIESKRPIKNKFRQIIDILPKLSIGRFGL